MNLWIINTAFEQVGLIDDYKSFIWTKRYFELGDCEVYIEASPRTISLLRKGYYIIKEDDDDMICRIENVELDTDAEQGDFLIVTGYDCRKILNQRLTWQQTTFKGTVEGFIRKIINDNVMNPALEYRKISNFALAEEREFEETIEIQSTFDYLFDKIKELCITYNYGSKVYYDENFLVFDLYRGVDRSIDQNENDIVVFSPEFENLITTKYKVDSSGLKTAVLVAGQGEGLDRVTTTIDGEGVGINRFELYVDARDVSSEISYSDLRSSYPSGTIVVEDNIVYYVVNDEKIAILDNVDTPTTGNLMPEPYKIILNQRGLEKFSENGVVVTFSGEVEPNYSFVYGEDYYLGDIVTVENDYGIKANARITEVIECDDDNGYSIIPTFEYISFSAFDEKFLLTEAEEIIKTEVDEGILYDD